METLKETTEIKKTETVENERPHHPHSPSSLQYKEVCPCYKSTNTGNARSIAGTMAHKVVETKTDDDRLDDWDAAAAAQCLDFLEQRRQLLLEDCFRAREAFAKNGWSEDRLKTLQILELQEIYLKVDDCHFPDGTDCTTGGYVDYALLSYNRTYAEMLDWKFGRWPVEKAENNLQAIAYAIGLFKKFPSLMKIKFFFKQPHLDWISDAVFTRDMIPQLYLRVQLVCARAREATARLEANPKDFEMAAPHIPVCNFCARLGSCDKVLPIALKVAQKFHPVKFPADIMPSTIMDPHNTRLALDLAGVLKVWAESFRRQVTDRCLRGDAQVPENYMLQTMDGRRTVADSKKFKEIALRHVTQEVWDASVDVTFGPIETAIKEAAPRGQKQSAVERFQQELLDSGAVAKGDGFSFLRAKAEKTS